MKNKKDKLERWTTEHQWR